MEKITLVSCYINDGLVKGLTDSLDRQTADIQRIIIDNKNKRFASMSECYNWAIDNAEGDVIFFAHQDIVFEDSDTILKMAELAESTGGIVGVAGVENEGRGAKAYLHIFDYADKREMNTLSEVKKVFSVDECLFCCTAELARKLRFDEKLCNGWHFYASELCWRCNTLGIPVHVMPAPGIWHNSQNNPIPRAYYENFDRIAAKYKKNFKFVTGTYGFMYTAFIPRKLLRLWLRVKKGL